MERVVEALSNPVLASRDFVDEGVARLRNDRLKGFVLGALVPSVVLIAGSAVAGTGVGGLFHLGQTNTVDAKSVLRGSAAGANLQLQNSGNGAGLGITVGAGKAPITVNSSAGVARNLKASFATNAGHASSATEAVRASSATTLGRGRTERGTFGLECPAQSAGDSCRAATSFAFPLSEAPVIHYVPAGGNPPSECPGTAADPQAEPGALCVYEAHRTASVASVGVFNPSDPSGASGAASPFGFGTLAVASAAGGVSAWGTWAVTAPVVAVPGPPG
jgi:hypothetical protein